MTAGQRLHPRRRQQEESHQKKCVVFAFHRLALSRSCPVREKILYSRRFILCAHRNRTVNVFMSKHTLWDFYLIERDWPSRHGSSRHLWFEPSWLLREKKWEPFPISYKNGSSRHDWMDLFLLYHFLPKKKLGSEKQMTDVVLSEVVQQHAHIAFIWGDHLHGCWQTSAREEGI